MLALFIVAISVGMISCGKDDGESTESNSSSINNPLVGKWKVIETWSYHYQNGGNYVRKTDLGGGDVYEFNADGTWRRILSDGRNSGGNDWRLEETNFNQDICPYEVWFYNQDGSLNGHLYICGPNYTSFGQGSSAVWMQSNNIRQNNAPQKLDWMYQIRATKIQ